MESSTHQQKLIDRVRKALALADDAAATDGEKDAALAAAQRIMLEHGLEMAHIEESKRDDHVGQHTLDDEYSYWESELLWAVARASFCKGWRYTSGKAHKWVLIGRPEHVQYVRELHAHLKMQAEGDMNLLLARMDKRQQYARMFIQRINARDGALNADSSDVAWKAGVLVAQTELRKAEDSAQLIADVCGIAWNYGAEVRAYVNRGDYAPAIVSNLGTYRRSFYTMFSIRVNERLEAMQEQTVGTMGNAGTDLVLNEWTEVNAWMDENAPKLDNTASERKWSKEGLAQGRSSGDRADLSTRNKVRGTTRELTS